MVTALTFEDAKGRLGKLAAERPDYVYEKVTQADSEDPTITWSACAYFDGEGNPSCIVGHAYAAELRGWDGFVEGLSASSVLADLGADRGAQELAREVQKAQDRGVPWGDAYSQALKRVERRREAGLHVDA